MRGQLSREAAAGLETLIEEVGIFRRRNGLPDLGTRLFLLKLDTVNLCNLACRHCGVHLIRDRAEPVTMSAELLNHVADEVFPCCHEVCFGSMAEPWMSPVIEDALALGRARQVPFLQVVTNASLLDERRARVLIDRQVDLVSVSLDAATPETYATIRGGDLGAVVKNVERLMALRERCGSASPRLRLSFVMLRSNLHEMPAMVDLAHDLGAELLDFTMPFLDRRQALEHELPSREPGLWEGMMEEARRRMKVQGLPTAHLPEVRGALAAREPASSGGQPAPGPGPGGTPLCFAPWCYLCIGPSGDVHPCCSPYLLGGPPFGNVRESALGEILDGPRYRELRRSLESGRLLGDCARCKATDFLSPCQLDEGYYLDPEGSTP
jgi:radical SAM protein with 4Fe4S-binding SPASM domain